MVIVAGVKAIWEDSKRHKEDWRTNASTAHVLRNNGALHAVSDLFLAQCGDTLDRPIANCKLVSGRYDMTMLHAMCSSKASIPPPPPPGSFARCQDILDRPTSWLVAGVVGQCCLPACIR